MCISHNHADLLFISIDVGNFREVLEIILFNIILLIFHILKIKCFEIQIVNLRIGLSLHAVNGSPIYPSTQVQEGMWFITLHWALIPHVPGQGSTHLFLWHALLEGQSELTTHSGLQAT